MKEQQEQKIKKALLDFVRKEFQPTGDPKAVSDLEMHIVDNLFLLFIEFHKYITPQKKD